MKILLLGSGGRESALAWGLNRSKSVDGLVAVPGNPGISEFAESIRGDINNGSEMAETARRIGADLVVIGPEAPLVTGVGDALRDAGFNVFGPSMQAARIEGSKSYAKQLMELSSIPTGAWSEFDAVEPAITYLDELGPPYVIKADGLAAGKGVVVTEDRDEAIEALNERLVEGRFGEAGRRVIIEEFLDGQEASLIALTDGRSLACCEPAQDYKRVFDADAGPNTGGMGSYSPVPACPSDLSEQIEEEVLKPMIATTAAHGSAFVGALYAGLALTSKGPKVVEFNARFGDPETQALIPRLKSDLGEAFLACATGQLEGLKLDWSPDVCVTIVLASSGYPGAHETGFAIDGLDTVSSSDAVAIFHAGTSKDPDGTMRTAGGRVLAVSAVGDSFREARPLAYDAASRIEFEGKHLRSDIGLRAERAEEAVS
jgi:phosphoribosylamine--glycine ligase